MMTHEIIGDDLQAVVLTLGPGDEIRAEAGAMTDKRDREDVKRDFGGALGKLGDIIGGE